MWEAEGDLTMEGITLLALKTGEGATTQGMKVPLEAEGKETNSPLEAPETLSFRA